MQNTTQPYLVWNLKLHKKTLKKQKPQTLWHLHIYIWIIHFKTAYFSLAGSSVWWEATLDSVLSGLAVLCLCFLLGAVSMTSGLPRRESLRSGTTKRKETKVDKNLNMKYNNLVLKHFLFIFIRISLLRWALIWQQLVSNQTDVINGNSKRQNLN